MKENNDNITGNCTFGETRLSFEIKRALLDSTPAPDSNKAFRDFLERNHIGHNKNRKIWLSITSIAAAACVALCLTLVPRKTDDNTLQRQRTRELAKLGSIIYQAPEDRQFITLVMGDKTINLAKGTTTSGMGIAMTHDNIIRVFDQQKDNHEDVTISVPAGQTAKVVLDDSTIVNINAGSRITFPHHFHETGTREVKLYGEAFFEVKHNDNRPFTVDAERLKTKVLGTKFNVRYFPGESCRVSLAEGSVEVATSDHSTILKPDETAWLRDAALEVGPTDTDLTMGWTHGEFYFDGQTFGEIMSEIGRWYNLNVVFANNKHLQEQLHFSAARTAPVEEIVRQLQMIARTSIELKTKEHTLLVR